MVLNALEFRLMARFAHHHPPVLEVFQVTILGSAANLLPVPGAVVVRLANLRKAGVRVTLGLNLTAIIGITWVGAVCTLGGVVQLFSHTAFGVIVLAIGLGLLGIALVMLVRVVDDGTRVAGRGSRLLAIESGFVLMQAFRLFLIASALRFNVSYAESTTLVIAAVSAAAIGFLPAGLGVREAIGAALAPVVGFPAAVGLVITVVDRAINLVVLSVFAARSCSRRGATAASSRPVEPIRADSLQAAGRRARDRAEVRRHEVAVHSDRQERVAGAAADRDPDCLTRLHRYARRQRERVALPGAGDPDLVDAVHGATRRPGGHHLGHHRVGPRRSPCAR